MIFFLISFLSIIFTAVILFFERKLIAISQKRLSISFLGRQGWIHVISDVFKFWFKTYNRNESIKNYSILSLLGSYLIWCLLSLIFFSTFNVTNFFEFQDFQFFIYLGYVSITNIYSILLITSLKSKYSIIAGLRLTLLTIFFEVPINLLLISIFMVYGDYSFYMFFTIKEGLFYTTPIFLTILIIYLLFESKRAPFDHTEAESELVAGHLIEFGGRTLFIFFICEYLHFFFLIFLVTLILFNGLTSDKNAEFILLLKLSIYSKF